MEIKFVLSDSAVKSSLASYVDNYLYDNYDAAVLKKAKVPARSALLKQLIADEKLSKIIADEFTGWFKSNSEDIIINALDSAELPGLSVHLEACDEIGAEAYRLEREANQLAMETANLERTISALKTLGYTVEKV
jgi:hypothetical protein